eukprot:scaffold190610_cov47-Prasinocladus_malaysianus.AAC.1
MYFCPCVDSVRIANDNVEASTLIKQSVAMFCAAAVLGPLCDGQHSSHNVLHYAEPQIISLPPVLTLET